MQSGQKLQMKFQLRIMLGFGVGGCLVFLGQLKAGEIVLVIQTVWNRR